MEEAVDMAAELVSAGEVVVPLGLAGLAENRAERARVAGLAGTEAEAVASTAPTPTAYHTRLSSTRRRRSLQ